MYSNKVRVTDHKSGVTIRYLVVIDVVLGVGNNMLRLDTLGVGG